MHSAVLAEKRIEEQQRMMEAASAIGEKLGIEDAASMLEVAPGGDPRLRQLYQDQALSTLLWRIHEALGTSEGAAQEDLPEPDTGKRESLDFIDGMNEEIASELREVGIKNGADLASADDEELLAVPGLGKSRLQKMRRSLGQE